MTTYIIELEIDGIDDDAELVVQNVAGAISNLIYNHKLTDNIKLACAYKLDEDASNIVSDGDLIYPWLNWSSVGANKKNVAASASTLHGVCSVVSLSLRSTGIAVTEEGL